MREGKKKKSTVLRIRAIHQQERERGGERGLLLRAVYFNKICIYIPTNTANGWLIQKRANKKFIILQGFAHFCWTLPA